MSQLTDKLKSILAAIQAHRLPLVAALLAFVLVALVLIRLKPVHPVAATAPVDLPQASATAPAVPVAPPGPQLTGQINLTDFSIVVPKEWQRRTELEEQGPGTKLFLAGPKVGPGQVFIGVDVYPVPPGMKVADFIKRYSKRWVGLGVINDQPASLCGKPARMLQMNDGKQDKLFLVAVRGNRGFVVGMFGPAKQSQVNIKTFKAVVDTFQFYG